MHHALALENPRVDSFRAFARVVYVQVFPGGFGCALDFTQSFWSQPINGSGGDREHAFGILDRCGAAGGVHQSVEGVVSETHVIPIGNHFPTGTNHGKLAIQALAVEA